jgi:hypothetical protein
MWLSHVPTRLAPIFFPSLESPAIAEEETTTGATWRATAGAEVRRVLEKKELLGGAGRGAGAG